MAQLWDLRAVGAVIETLEQRFLLSGEVPQADPLLHTTPYAPVTVQAPQAATQFPNIQALPGSFSLLPSYVTGIRDQGQCGSCWSFATYASLESWILKAGGPATDFSENNLKDYHGFDWGPCDGGNSYISEAYLSRGSGPVSEANDPYNAWDDRVTPAPSYPRENWVTQMLRYDTMDEMKNALITNGALYTTMEWDDGSYRDSDFTFYYTGSGSNHAVTIVGWDDNKITAAPTPGAWLIKNSWSTGWGNTGYFWLSYADGAGAKSGESFGGAVPASTYTNVYYWDSFGDVTEMDAPWAMNRFVAQSDEQLKAVGFFTEADNAAYTISVYDTFSGGSLSGLLGSSSGTSATAGWHTINLPSTIGLTTGNDFYVVVSITNGGAYPQAYDCQAPGYSSACTAAPNESWYSSNGTSWTDLTSFDPSANFCVKAFTSSDNNRAPTGIALSPSSIPENQSSGTAVGTLSTTDPDAGNTFTYTLVNGNGGTGNGSFSISGSTLRTAAVFNYQAQNSYSIRVRTTDQGGLWYEQTFTITVTQVTHGPTDIALAGNSVPEKEPSGTTVGTLSTTDSVPGNNTFTYRLVTGPGGIDNGSFSISGNQLRTAAVFDYAVKSSYSIRVRTTDQGGLWYEKVLTIMVEGVNQSPTDITLASTLAFENRPAGTVIGGILGTDPDPWQSAVLTFGLVPGYGDNSLFAIVNNQLRAMVTFDNETRNSYDIRLRATDPGALWYEKAFRISVIDVNENPTDIALANMSVAENLHAGAVVGAVSGTDPDAGQNATLTFSLPSGYGDNSLFQVVGSQLMTRTVFDYETRSSYSIQLRATDTGGLSYDKAFTITVTNVNDNPTDIALANTLVAENLPIGAVVGAISGTDPDAGQSATLTFGLVPGYGDNSLFQVVGNQLMTKAVFDYETRSSYSIRLRATDTGGLSYDKGFAITVTDVNDNPTNIALANMSVAENLPAGAVVGAVSGTDPDAGQSATLTFALVPGYGDNSLFELVGNQLKTASRFDYEGNNSYSIRVRATDTGGLSYEKAITISVIDVNENPTDIALANMSVAENLPAGAVVGTASGTDPDAGQNATMTFSLPSGYADNSLFQVVGSQLMTKAVFDYETRSSYSIRLRATDTGGLSYDKGFAITVTDVNDNPTDIALANTSVAENLPAGAVVGAISGTDPDAGQSATLRFGLLPGYGDNSLFELVGNQLKTASRFDYEGNNSYSIRVRATDTGGLSYDEAFTIAVTDDPSDLRSTFGLVNGKTVASPALQDADGDLVTFKLTGGGVGKVYGFDKSFEDITLSGTGLKTVLTITVKKSVSGDGLVTIGNLSSDGLIKSISGTAAILSGQVRLNVLNQTAGKTAVSMTFRQISDADIQVQGLPVSSIAVSGDVSNSRIATTGSITTFSAATLLGSDILVGVAKSFAGDFASSASDFADSTAKLGSLKVSGRKLPSGSSNPAYVAGSCISAPNVGTLTLLNVPGSSAPVVHVLNDAGVLKVSQSKLTSTAMFGSGTWKVAGVRPAIWEVV